MTADNLATCEIVGGHTPPLQCRHLRNRRAVVARVGSAKVHTVAIAHYGLAETKQMASRLSHCQFVAASGQLHSNIFGNERFDRHITSLKCAFREASGLEGFLDVETVVGDIGYELRMRLRLIEAAHYAKGDAYPIPFHESRNDGVQRPLSRFQRVGMILFQSKERATVVQHEAVPRGTRPDPKPL